MVCKFQEIKIKTEVMFDELYSRVLKVWKILKKICLHFHRYNIINDSIIRVTTT